MNVRKMDSDTIEKVNEISGRFTRFIKLLIKHIDNEFHKAELGAVINTLTWESIEEFMVNTIIPNSQNIRDKVIPVFPEEDYNASIETALNNMDDDDETKFFLYLEYFNSLSPVFSKQQ